MAQNFFASCPKGLEGLLLSELKALMVEEPHETVAGVSFKGTFEVGMRVCLWSRFASRVLLQLSEFFCEDDSDLYIGAQAVAWERYFTPQQSIAVDFSGMSETLRNTQYSAVRVKDAICDRFSSQTGMRPSVDREHPEVRIFARLSRQQSVVISLDLSGGALLKRDIQRQTGIAPLKENLAAAIVERSGYTKGNFCDPMCGSGTLLLEAAFKLTDTAPGLMRTHFGFFSLKQFSSEAWQRLLSEAKTRHEQGLTRALEAHCQLQGFDMDERVVAYAQENVRKAGFEELITVSCCALSELYNPFASSELPLTCVTNPPYGVRMGNFNELLALYTELGTKFKQQFGGSRVAVISSSEELLSCLRMRADKVYHLFNGELACQLRVYTVKEASEQTVSTAGSTEAAQRPVDFINRLTKNLAKYRKLAAQQQVDAYRVYDADVPEYAAAIDYYAGFYVVYAYEAPSTVPAWLARQHLLDLVQATVQVTGVPGEQVILKQRAVKKGAAQYEKAEEARGIFYTVNEMNCLFRVNLYDYLDTGLFLDARLIRQQVRRLSEGRSVLNLFAYTCTASVCAALGGALHTHSVDMSRTYLEWGMENFRLNKLDLKNHTFEQADCLSWLSVEHGQQYDLVYIDPPTFSNSKRMERSFEVRRDQVALLANVTRHLKDEGLVIFCTNQHNFKISDELQKYGYSIEDISAKTLPFDFKRTPKIHSCFMLHFKRSLMTEQPEKMTEQLAPSRWSGELKASSPYGGANKEQRGPYRRSAEHSHSRAQEGDSFPERKFKRGPERRGRGRDEGRREKPRAVRVWGPEGVKPGVN
ncbi:MAG: bifunctional 23S rRNA (guanine(2069)-N(7))-methyltransferase RlmK/23S rRNA (guanine(2445)-N(2))-methyltransferase RlmL [Succinivibrio sp.]|nr:bifunctional 23S rRNA (guanine(2069)-N(7))-methyltransferase RlmK/23S rRNA (guanine(2445)-N(2))-methyltransferase RlmL [Succinivibrio sp.]